MSKKKKKAIAVDKKIEKLLEIYTRAEKNLIDIIAKKQIKGNSTRFYTEMLKQVQQEILRLKVFNTQFAIAITKQLYLQAFEEQLKMLNIDEYSFTALHKEAVELITNNMINNLNNAVDLVGRRTEDAIRDIGLSSAVDKFATGYTIKQQQENLKQELLDKNITCIKDKLGRNISVKSYASMVARSVVAETQNTCIKNLAKEYNHDLVKMTHHATSCHICSPYEGKIYSISGKDEKYPPLSSVPGFGAGYNNIHPNCRHRVFVYVSKYNEDNNKENEKAKNKDNQEIEFKLEGMKEERKSKLINTITELSSKYNTRLIEVNRDASKKGVKGSVGLDFIMSLSTTKKDTIVHEFAHSLSMTKADKYGLTDDKEFWKEIKKVRTQYKKAIQTNESKKISEYSLESVDEFMAEAFAHSYLKDTDHLGWEYGKDFEYSDKVMQIIDKYFKK